MEEIKKMVKDHIELYHQANYYEIFPAGPVRDWIIDAVAQNVVIPMQAEIDDLKAKLKNN